MNGTLLQYIGGFLLCLAVAFVYALTRKDTPRDIFRHTVRVFAYIILIIAAAALVVLILTVLSGKLR